MLMALLGGLGGGITRDVLVAEVPSALTNPAYITLALLFGAIGYLLAFGEGQLFREGLFQFMTAFSLPWYAIVGAQKGVTVGLPVFACLLLALVGPTAGRYYIDISSGNTAKQFIRSESFIGTASTIRQWSGFLSTGPARAPGGPPGSPSLSASASGWLALFRGWEEPPQAEPKGVVLHKDHVLLGRKLSGKSQRELSDLGLIVENGPAESETAA